MASGRDFVAIKRVIKDLDMARRQIFIEALILEVQLSKELNIGTSSHGGYPTDRGDLIIGGVSVGLFVAGLAAPRVGRLIAQRLRANGVSKLFTLSGGHLFSIYDGCRAEGIDLNPHYRYLVHDWPWIRPYLADDFDPPHAPLGRELHHHPVVAGAAAAARLPAVAHVVRAAGHDQVVLRTEEHVAAREHVAAVLRRGEIDFVAETAGEAPVGNDVAVHAQASDAAVRKDIDAEMRHRERLLHFEFVLQVALQVRLRQQFRPVLAVDRAIDRARVGIVAAEEARVDDHAAHDASYAESQDREVVSGHALAAALPPVHPLPAVRVLVFLPDGRMRLDEIFFLGEEVVVRVEHRAAEALGGEIELVAEIHARSVRRPRTHVSFTTPCSVAPR